ncbi:effector-associated constant component EACC1 [Actinomadura scrupuli]|uniref:effector-associated constant component EACC1 n=1 Tax=Actinomadura scrupuli TaxID=559629 RepID=UPI003D953D67
MEFRISLVGGAPGADVESLGDWLRGEPELAGRVRGEGAAPRPGELGAALDVLVVAVGSGGALTVLGKSLSTWLTQPRRSQVRIRVKGEAGRVIEIDADRVDGARIETLLREVLQHSDADE